jgi:hypothetical protein
LALLLLSTVIPGPLLLPRVATSQINILISRRPNAAPRSADETAWMAVAVARDDPADERVGTSLSKLATMVGKRSVEHSSASRDQADLAERFHGIAPMLPLERLRDVSP